MNDALAGLVGVGELRQRLGEPGLCIVDCRHDLMQPAAGRAAYELGHIPGAQHAHLDHDLSGPPGDGAGRHPLPDRAVLAARFRAWGVDPETLLVAYDGSSGSYAARLWWLARWLGHARVALLDGGWTHWQREGGPVASGPGATDGRRGRFEAAAPLDGLLDAAAIDRLRRDPQRLLLDARAPDRYDGSKETIDPVGGHIPGARNRPWADNLAADGRFKPAAQLRDEYQVLLAGRDPTAAAVYCGSGVTACHLLFALHHAGLPGAALYPPSWSGWIADPAHAVAGGPQPGTA